MVSNNCPQGCNTRSSSYRVIGSTFHNSRIVPLPVIAIAPDINTINCIFKRHSFVRTAQDVRIQGFMQCP